MKYVFCTEYNVNLDKIQSIRKPGILCFKMPNVIVRSSTRSVYVGGIYFQRQIVSGIDGDINCNQTEIYVYFNMHPAETAELISVVQYWLLIKNRLLWKKKGFLNCHPG